MANPVKFKFKFKLIVLSLALNLSSGLCATQSPSPSAIARVNDCLPLYEVNVAEPLADYEQQLRSVLAANETANSFNLQKQNFLLGSFIIAWMTTIAINLIFMACTFFNNCSIGRHKAKRRPKTSGKKTKIMQLNTDFKQPLAG